MLDIDGKKWGNCSWVKLAREGPHRYTGKAAFEDGGTVNLIAQVDGQNVSYRVIDAFSPDNRPMATSKPDTSRWGDVIGGIVAILLLVGVIAFFIEHPGVFVGLIFLDWLMREDDR